MTDKIWDKYARRHMESEQVYYSRDRAKVFDMLYYFGEEWVGWGDGDKDNGRFKIIKASFLRKYPKSKSL